MVGAVRGIDPETGHYFDDTKRYLDQRRRWSSDDGQAEDLRRERAAGLSADRTRGLLASVDETDDRPTHSRAPTPTRFARWASLASRPFTKRRAARD